MLSRMDGVTIEVEFRGNKAVVPDPCHLCYCYENKTKQNNAVMKS